jgi:hypothetical protein
MWVKLDDGFFENPVIADLSKDAQLLYLAGLTYCAKQLTDGHLSPVGVRMSRALSGARSSAVKELAEAGRWIANGQGYEVHDWADYNPSAAEILAKREAKHEAKRRAGQAGGLATAQAKRDSAQADSPAEEESAQAESKPRIPYPVSRTSRNPSPPAPTAEAAGAAHLPLLLKLHEEVSDKSPTTMQVRSLEKMARELPPGEKGAAIAKFIFEEMAEADARALKYAWRVLERVKATDWQIEGVVPDPEVAWAERRYNAEKARQEKEGK